jgi:hypothetical protein
MQCFIKKHAARAYSPDVPLQAKEALERRRLERLADDQRMRQPWQQPEAPKKSILRAGQKKPKAVSVSLLFLLAIIMHAMAVQFGQ